MTVFGGYHPLLGSLVMKHGGHTDLIELASLAKIEREMSVRSKWKIDRLKKKLDWQHEQQQKQQQQQQLQEYSHHERRSTIRMMDLRDKFSAVHFLQPSSPVASIPSHSRSSSASHHHHQLENDSNKQKKDERKSIFNQLKAAHLFMPSASSVSTLSHSPTSSFHHQQQLHNDNIMTQQEEEKTKNTSFFGSLTAAHFLKPSSSSAASSGSPSRHSQAQVKDNFHLHQQQQQQQQQEQQQRERIEEEIQAIQHAVEDMKCRIPSFRMIYISPMHVRERAEELKHRSFASSSSSMMMKSMSSVPGQPLMDMSKWKEHLQLTSKLSSVTEEKSDYAASVAIASQNGGMDGEGTKSFEEKQAVISTSSLPPSVVATGVGTKLPGSNSSMPSSRMGRELHLYGSPLTKNSSIHVQHDHVDFCFGGNFQFIKEDDSHEKQYNLQQKNTTGTDGRDGYASLMAFVDHLREHQEMNEWKITLAQQKIGSSISSNDDNSQSSSKTASYLLAKGMLHGPLLHHLIDSEIQVIRNLQLLTMPEELNAVEKVRAEYEEIVACQQTENCQFSAAKVSKLANNFVGKAIHKNFDPVKGRFVMLRQFGIDLRNDSIHLNPNEVVPAKHLENLFCHLNLEQRTGSVDDVDGSRSYGNQEVIGGHQLMDSTFDMNYNYSDHLLGNRNAISPDQNHPIFASGLDQWQSLLELSISMKHPNATQRIWTCGLTDGGLHNMFLSEDYMWLFDLGEPCLEPIPAFLTKFLMSFFHTLGMEEDENGDWIVRFEQNDSGKLRLTQQTKEMLPTVMRAFNTTLDRLINELFGGEEEIRILLLRYVVTQLISDCAFCIEKWRIKGGGDELRSEHQNNIEKWLWRALWDVYASEEIRRRYLTRLLFRRQAESRGLSLIDLEAL